MKAHVGNQIRIFAHLVPNLHLCTISINKSTTYTKCAKTRIWLFDMGFHVKRPLFYGIDNMLSRLCVTL